MNNEDLMDLFAGLAMQGYLARGSTIKSNREFVVHAYNLAEAMIKEKEARRDRTNESD